MHKIIGFVLAFSVVANAQSLSVGLLGGIPFTEAVKTTTIGKLAVASNSANFVTGPSVQVNLPKNLRIEVDALYRPLGFNVGLLTAAGREWRIPVMLQYRFGKSSVRPFVGGGFSIDKVTGLKVIVSGPGQLLKDSQVSTVLGAGLDIKVPLIRRLSAEIRYTRMGTPTIQDLSNLNRAEVLVGFHF